ncbi:phosphotransferase system HPr (HPr) family [Priestia endophytica DSM 13796]|uniref:Phosphotransferase system HPr (HPr) family n=1 Tax=Priestia endophytica DSM 13796 TaxID=1121089 RepID=A0A1I5YNE1_9BACI|nr:phosphotransferase system HPr (HPr) family [Priestia endophytica DSM 13796]
MNSVEIRIMNTSGLHARHATQFIKVLDKFHSEISVIKGD